MMAGNVGYYWRVVGCLHMMAVGYQQVVANILDVTSVWWDADM